jgi:hypothetical protein
VFTVLKFQCWGMTPFLGVETSRISDHRWFVKNDIHLDKIELGWVHEVTRETTRIWSDRIKNQEVHSVGIWYTQAIPSCKGGS